MSTATPARRTRTGCKTCRQRKLKCDEVKPLCGQCRKSNRECVASEGIAFRHAQNAGFAGQNGGDDLANFYKYRQKFKNTYFLPVPKELSFVHVTDPYAVANEPLENVSQASQQLHPMQQGHHDQYALPPLEHSDPQYVDVAASSLKAMIDPNLEEGTSMIPTVQDHHTHQEVPLPGISEAADADNINETIMKALATTTDVVNTLP